MGTMTNQSERLARLSTISFADADVPEMFGNGFYFCQICRMLEPNKEQHIVHLKTKKHRVNKNKLSGRAASSSTGNPSYQSDRCSGPGPWDTHACAASSSSSRSHFERDFPWGEYIGDDWDPCFSAGADELGRLREAMGPRPLQRSDWYEGLPVDELAALPDNLFLLTRCFLVFKCTMCCSLLGSSILQIWQK